MEWSRYLLTEKREIGLKDVSHHDSIRVLCIDKRTCQILENKSMKNRNTSRDKA